MVVRSGRPRRAQDQSTDSTFGIVLAIMAHHPALLCGECDCERVAGSEIVAYWGRVYVGVLHSRDISIIVDANVKALGDDSIFTGRNGCDGSRNKCHIWL